MARDDIDAWPLAIDACAQALALALPPRAIVPRDAGLYKRCDEGQEDPVDVAIEADPCEFLGWDIDPPLAETGRGYTGHQAAALALGGRASVLLVQLARQLACERASARLELDIVEGCLKLGEGSWNSLHGHGQRAFLDEGGANLVVSRRGHGRWEYRAYRDGKSLVNGLTRSVLRAMALARRAAGLPPRGLDPGPFEIDHEALAELARQSAALESAMKRDDGGQG